MFDYFPLKKALQVHTHGDVMKIEYRSHVDLIWIEFLCSFVYFFLLIGRLDKRSDAQTESVAKLQMLCLCEDVVSVSANVWNWNRTTTRFMCSAVPIKYSQNVNYGHLLRLSLKNYNFNLLFIILIFFKLYFLCGFSKGIIQNPLFILDPTSVFTVTDCMWRS